VSDGGGAAPSGGKEQSSVSKFCVCVACGAPGLYPFFGNVKRERHGGIDFLLFRYVELCNAQPQACHKRRPVRTTMLPF